MANVCSASKKIQQQVCEYDIDKVTFQQQVEETVFLSASCLIHLDTQQHNHNCSCD